MARHMLILEPGTDGHEREWLRHLIRYLGANPGSSQVSLVVASSVHAELAPVLPAQLQDRVRMICLGRLEQRLCSHGHPPAPYSEEEAALAGSMPSDRRGFVLFGVLTERKGVVALLRALEQLKPQAAAQAAVLLAGRLDPAIRSTVQAQCARIAAARPE